MNRDDHQLHPYRIETSAATLADLRERLERTRLLPQSTGRPWSALQNDHLAELVEAWKSFDWAKRHPTPRARLPRVGRP